MGRFLEVELGMRQDPGRGPSTNIRSFGVTISPLRVAIRTRGVWTSA